MTMARMMQSYEDGIYSTTDLYFAAFLQAMGIHLEEISRDAGRASFRFDIKEDELDELRDGWDLRTVKVPAHQFADSVKALKAAVFR